MSGSLGGGVATPAAAPPAPAALQTATFDVNVTYRDVTLSGSPPAVPATYMETLVFNWTYAAGNFAGGSGAISGGSPSPWHASPQTNPASVNVSLTGITATLAGGTNVDNLSYDVSINFASGLTGPNSSTAISGGNFDVSPVTVNNQNGEAVGTLGGAVVPASLACFAAGTRIATPAGNVPVETLRVGDWACVRHAEIAEIVWLGHRRVVCAGHPRPWEVWPVRVRAGAFGADLPSADLFLSPEHAVHVVDGSGGCLVPIRHLVNATTIAQVEVSDVSYWHVELARHDVLLAEGLPCESYLETGSRASFANATIVALVAAFGADTAGEAWMRRACAPLVETGPVVGMLRQTLEARARGLGYPPSSIQEAHIASSGEHHFHLPTTTETVRLCSPSLVPGSERRRLGAAVTRLVLDGTTIPLDDPRLCAGFHAVEGDPQAAWRWTDGGGEFHVGRASSPRTLEVTLVTVMGSEAQAA